MNADHEYLKRMQKEYGAVIQSRQGWESLWITMGALHFHPNFSYRICPIWLEERFKEAATAEIFYAEYPKEEEHEFTMGGPYWYVYIDGAIIENIWREDVIDFLIYGMGNAFHTKEEAQVARDRQLARVKAERERTSEPQVIWVNQINNGIRTVYDSPESAAILRCQKEEHFEYIGKRFVEAD